MIEIEENPENFINWIYYISKDHLFLLKKGLDHDKWVYFERKIDSKKWSRTQKLVHYDFISSAELEDYLNFKVHWHYYCTERHPKSVLYKFSVIG